MTTEQNNLVYIGFNSQVVALDKHTGNIIWDWKAPKGRGYVSLLLLDENQLIASVIGYTYSLDARTGKEQWFNELTGYGTGVVSMVALNRSNPHDTLVAAASADESQSSASTAATTMD